MLSNLMIIMLIFSGEHKIKFDLIPENTKFERWEISLWLATMTADVATTYDAIHNNGARELNPLFSNFDKDTKIGEMFLQSLLVDISLQYLTFKITKRKSIRLFILSHGFAASWNYKIMREK